MNHQIRRLSTVMALALIALLINLSVTQVLQANSLRLRPDNTRLLLEEYGRERGPIVVDGREIALSVPTGGTLNYERRYTDGATYAPATGFYSLVYGATGIERLYSDVLSGRDDRLTIDRLRQLLSGQESRGGAVTLSLNAKMQKAAFTGLNGRRGAVVALDPETGAILTLVSSPSFSPEELSNNNTASVRAAYNRLIADPDQPMLNRPLVQTLPPGSTFKLVVAAAALESGRFTPDSVLPGPAYLALPNSTKKLGNWQNGPCSANGKVTLRRALEISCNTAFAWLGMKLGADALQAQAEKFGFNESFAVPMNAAASVFPTGLDGAQTAMSAIGQFDVRATALQMAMVVGAISNDGNVMAPYLIKNVMSPSLSIIEQTHPRTISNALSPENSAALLSMMQSVVTNGTASSGRITGITVGAKTGTAETGTTASPHAWFVATAIKDGKKIVVAAVVENGGGAAEVTGNRIAGPIVAAVIKAAYQ